MEIDATTVVIVEVSIRRVKTVCTASQDNELNDGHCRGQRPCCAGLDRTPSPTRSPHPEGLATLAAMRTRSAAGRESSSRVAIRWVVAASEPRTATQIHAQKTAAAVSQARRLDICQGRPSRRETHDDPDRDRQDHSDQRGEAAARFSLRVPDSKGPQGSCGDSCAPSRTAKAMSPIVIIITDTPRKTSISMQRTSGSTDEPQDDGDHEHDSRIVPRRQDPVLRSSVPPRSRRRIIDPPDTGSRSSGC